MPYAASPRGGKAVRTLAQKDVGTRKAQGETPLGGRVGATPSPRDPHRAATAVKATAGETRGPRSARSPRVGAQAVQDHERVRWAAWEAPASAKHSGTARPHPDANGANAPGLAGRSRAPRPGLPGPTDTGPVNRGRAGDSAAPQRSRLGFLRPGNRRWVGGSTEHCYGSPHSPQPMRRSRVRVPAPPVLQPGPPHARARLRTPTNRIPVPARAHPGAVPGVGSARGGKWGV